MSRNEEEIEEIAFTMPPARFMVNDGKSYEFDDLIQDEVEYFAEIMYTHFDPEDEPPLQFDPTDTNGVDEKE